MRDFLTRWKGAPEIMQIGSPDDSAVGEFVALVVDGSRSMDESDFLPSRFTAPKQAVAMYMDAKRAIDPRDKVAIVAFSGRAETVADLGADRASALERLARISTRWDGTNIYAGLNNALLLHGKTVKDHPEATRRIVLLSDGAQNRGDARKLLNQAITSG